MAPALHSGDICETQDIFPVLVHCAKQPLDLPRAGCPSDLRIFHTKPIHSISQLYPSLCAYATAPASTLALICPFSMCPTFLTLWGTLTFQCWVLATYNSPTSLRIKLHWVLDPSNWECRITFLCLPFLPEDPLFQNFPDRSFALF